MGQGFFTCGGDWSIDTISEGHTKASLFTALVVLNISVLILMSFGMGVGIQHLLASHHH